MGGRDKVLVQLGGEPLLLWSLRACEAAPSVRRVVVTASPHNLVSLERAVGNARLDKVTMVVTGGATRAHSVLCGLEALAADPSAYAVVHDGARPFVTPDLIERTLAAAREAGAALAATPAVDTVKIVDAERLVMESPARARVWLAQTPQAGRLADLLRAHRAERERLATFTDDVALLATLGIRARAVESDPLNFKVTTPADLRRAEAVAAARHSIA